MTPILLVRDSSAVPQLFFSLLEPWESRTTILSGADIVLDTTLQNKRTEHRRGNYSGHHNAELNTRRYVIIRALLIIGCSGSVSHSCSTSCTRRVTLVKISSFSKCTNHRCITIQTAYHNKMNYGYNRLK